MEKLSLKSGVCVISQLGKEELHHLFAQSAPKMGLAAENGFFYRVNSDNKGEKEWNKLIKVNDFLWMDTILNVV